MKKYIDLINQLTDEDRYALNSYINDFGIHLNQFIGLDSWLQNWSHSNQKLYRLFGNSFIIKYPFSYQKDKQMLFDEIESKLIYKNNFRNIYYLFLGKISKKYSLDKDIDALDIIYIKYFLDDKISKDFNFKKPGAKKTLQLKAGMKPIRALNKIIEYFKEDFMEVKSEQGMIEFEDFKQIHSMIFNDKEMRGNLCLSIHPLDFLTMSDNASNWSSCMTWKEKGCYHSGTIEMMNSNNVVCCYIEDISRDFSFPGLDENKEGHWNNKKWRQLAYVTKDIIMTGKAYPYQKAEFSKQILNYLKDLAEKNLNWFYSFGIEEYLDMKHIDSLGKMAQNWNWIWTKTANKHNIIWNTKAMYNDMYNDKDTIYWCYRNKVKSNKIISVSGKCNCLRCNGDIIKEKTFQECGEDYYNDRFCRTNSHLCEKCSLDYFCDVCARENTQVEYINLKIKSIYTDNYTIEKHICKNCFDKYVKKCPCCGEPTLIGGKVFIETPKNIPHLIMNYNTTKLYYNYDGGIEDLSDIAFGMNEENRTSETLWMCSECLRNLAEGGFITYIYLNEEYWSYNINKGCNIMKTRSFPVAIFTEEIDKEKYRYKNLKSVPFENNIKVKLLEVGINRETQGKLLSKIKKLKLDDDFIVVET